MTNINQTAPPDGDGLLTNVCDIAWTLLHGKDDRGIPQEKIGDSILHRAYMPDDESLFQFGKLPDGQYGYHYAEWQDGKGHYTNKPVCTQFYVTAILPYGLLWCAINVGEEHHTDDSPHGHIISDIIAFDDIAQRFIPRLREAGGTVWDEDKTLQLISELTGTDYE